MTSILKNILPKINLVFKNPNFSKTLTPNFFQFKPYSNLLSVDSLTPYEIVKDSKVQEAEDKVFKSGIKSKI